MKKLIIPAFALLLALGCTTEKLNLPHKEALTSQKIDSIREGKSTKEDILRTFGRPVDRLNFQGHESWFYKDFNLRTVYIEFDENGVVSDVETE